MDAKVTASLLDRRARERAAQRERVRVEVLWSLRAAIADARLAGGRVWLIGSLAWGGFFPTSDIDLVVDGVAAEEASRLEHVVRCATQRDVDLMELGELPQSFRQRVVRDGLSLYGA